MKSPAGSISAGLFLPAIKRKARQGQMDNIIFPLLVLLMYPFGVIIMGAGLRRGKLRVFLLGVLLMLSPLAIMTLLQSQAF